MNRLLQSGFTHTKRDDYPTTDICGRRKPLSKNLYDHFVPSQRCCKAILSDYALKRVQTGQDLDSLLTKWLLLSKIVPVSAQRACLLSEGFSLYPAISHLGGNHSIRGASSWFCIVIQATWLEVVLYQSCTKSQNRVLINGAAVYGDS